MAPLSWNDQYLIGQPTIDDEHKTLFRLINDFHTHWTENRDRKDIARVLKQWLVDPIARNGYECRNFLIRKRRES